jgi:hypothetical protein
LPRRGTGKRGGFRTLIAYKTSERAVYLFGFAKNERENIAPDQLADLKAVAGDILKRSEPGLAEDIAEGRLQEVDHAGEH